MLRNYAYSILVLTVCIYWTEVFTGGARRTPPFAFTHGMLCGVGTLFVVFLVVQWLRGTNGS